MSNLTSTAYELMARYEQIASLRNPSQITITREEGQQIIETLNDQYGIWRGQDDRGKFVWYNANDQMITKEEVG